MTEGTRCEATFFDHPDHQCNQPEGHSGPHSVTLRIAGVTYWRDDEPPTTTCETCGQPERRKP